MQGIASTINETGSPARIAPAQTVAGTHSAYQGYQILRRNGAVVSFEPSKIAVALMKAFLAVHGTQGAASASVRETVDGLTESVVRALLRSRPAGGTFHIEDIQDQVELGLMRGSHHEVARAYVLYRERRSQDRQKSGQVEAKVAEPELFVTDKGERVPLDVAHLHSLIVAACAGLGADVTPDPVFAETRRNLYDGVPMDEVYKAAILASRTLIEKEPGYTRATARLLMHTIRREILNEEVSQEQMAERYAEYFPKFIKRGIKAELLDEKLGQYDLARLGAALDHSRDMQFDYLGLQTLYDRYFLHDNDERIELPQAFFMRVAMGLALREIDREARAIEFYNVLSSVRLHVVSTPTLFNAGTLAQRSCPPAISRRWPMTSTASTKALKENALAVEIRRRPGQRLDATYARWARYIKGTNGKSPRHRTFPQGRQRHGSRSQPGGQTQGCGVRLPGNLARWTSKNFSSCARIRATTAAARMT